MLTPQEVSTHSFAKASFGGYNMAMVDEFLDELTDDYPALYKENAALKAKLKVRVEKVEDVLNLGDMTWVKFMGFDEKGRANFSRRDALKEMAEQNK